LRKQGSTRPAAVRWLGSAALFRALRKLARLAMDGDAIDARDWMQPNLLVWQRDHLESLTDPATWDTGPSAPEDGTLWCDYVADTGDDGQATHDLACLLQGDLWLVPQPDDLPATVCLSAHPNTLHLPRGAFLVLGGDTAYPVATAEAIRTRLIAPWEDASRQRVGAGIPPPSPRPLLGIPGNHDWADSLDGFGRLVRCPVPAPASSDLAPRPGAQGPLRLPGHISLQSASYFAVRLPWQWDLWAVDLHMGHLDYRQCVFFAQVDRRRQGPPEQRMGRKLVLLCPRPVIASCARDAQVERELERVVASGDPSCPPFQLRLDLAGDVHHYQRYALGADTEVPGGQRMAVVAGGGGAFIHSTHTPLGPLLAQMSYPTPEASQAVFQRLLIPWTLYQAGMLPWLLVLLQLGLLWRLMAPAQGRWLMALSPLAGLYGLWVGRSVSARSRRWAMGIGGGLGMLTAFGSAWLMSTWPAWGWATLLWGGLATLAGLSGGVRTRPGVHPAWAVLWVLAVAGLEAWLPYPAVLVPTLLPGTGQPAIAVGWAAVTLIGSPVLLGGYLLGALRMGAHLNEAAATRRCARYRHFIRFKLEPDRLTGYVIGIDRPSPLAGSQPEAQLIDQFTLIAHG